MSDVDFSLEVLKSLVLARNAITVMVPQCAQYISHAVFQQTNRQLSEIAILRLFNFSPAKFPPSSYTKDVLANYCGYKDYLNFCQTYDVTTNFGKDR